MLNHLRSNKNIRKTRSRTHGGDRKARPITNHDRRRTRGVWGSDRTEDTSIGSGVERGARVGDPLGAGRRRQSHGAEGLIIVHTRSLSEPPEKPASLVALQCAISLTLMRPDSLASHHIATRRTRHEVPRLVGKESRVLLFHRAAPVRIRQGVADRGGY